MSVILAPLRIAVKLPPDAAAVVVVAARRAVVAISEARIMCFIV
jgi:hypothetical protein